MIDIIDNMKEAMNHEFKKCFGQNFISDTNLLSSIASDAGVNEGDTIIEIGTGAGTLTTMLAKKAKRVFTFEIDRSLNDILAPKFENYDNIELIFEDIMKVTVEDIQKLVGDGDFKVVANIPYYITTPIIFKFIKNFDNLKSMTIMVQKEVADRMVSPPDTKDYGALSVMTSYYGRAKVTRKVSRNMFYPVPNVDSAVVRIDMYENRDKSLDKIFQNLVKAAFHMRRKTLANNFSESFNIKSADASKLISGAGLDPRVRGEKLNVNEYIRLAKTLRNMQI